MKQRAEAGTASLSLSHCDEKRDRKFRVSEGGGHELEQLHFKTKHGNREVPSVFPLDFSSFSLF